MDASGVFIFLVIAIIVVVIVIQVKGNARMRTKNAEDHVIGALRAPGVSLAWAPRFTSTELIEGYFDGAARHPLVGLTARVEDSGTLNRRITATRLVALGVFALAVPKKQDDREVYLTIEGPSTAILHTISLKKGSTITGAVVRKFAMELNAAIRVAESKNVVGPGNSEKDPA